MVADVTVEGMVEMSQWVLYKNRHQYAFLPTCSRKYMIINDFNDQIITAEFCAQLPFEKTCIVPKSNAKYTVSDN